MTATRAIGLSAFGYYLPPTRRTIGELHADGKTTSDPAKLAELGYDAVHVAGDDDGVVDLAARAVADMQVRFQRPSLDDVGAILVGAGLGTSGVCEPPPGFAWDHAPNPLPLFKYPATRLQERLGLAYAPVMAVSQMACNAFHGCLRVARALLLSEPALEHVLCVTADRFPAEANREIVFNLMSDGAAAAVVSRGSERHRVLAQAQVTRGIYWDGETHHDQLIAAYFPIAQAVVKDALTQAGLTASDLKLFIPHNITIRSWPILARMLGLAPDKLYTDNIARIGHVVASDNLINYADALDSGRLAPGDKVALFVTGFGAHWSCLIMEV